MYTYIVITVGLGFTFPFYFYQVQADSYFDARRTVEDRLDPNLNVLPSERVVTVVKLKSQTENHCFAAITLDDAKNARNKP